MFGISFEHIVIVGVILVIMGPRRLPEIGSSMGKAIKNFKDSFSGTETADFKKLNVETTTTAQNQNQVDPSSKQMPV